MTPFTQNLLTNGEPVDFLGEVMVFTLPTLYIVFDGNTTKYIFSRNCTE